MKESEPPADFLLKPERTVIEAVHFVLLVDLYPELPEIDVTGTTGPVLGGGG